MAHRHYDDVTNDDHNEGRYASNCVMPDRQARSQPDRSEMRSLSMPPAISEEAQQHELLVVAEMFWPPILTVLLPPVLTVALPIRSLICRAIVKNACSTLVADLAEVSRKGIESPSANSLATVYSTTFLSDMSDLLPTRSLLTPSVA